MYSKGRLLELDSLRGIAAVCVVLFHYTSGVAHYNTKFNFGCTGVELFFLISGFVIFLTIQKSKTTKSFLVSRFARIYPAYWACVTITALVSISFALLTKQILTFPGIKDYLVNLSMIQYYFNIRNIDNAYWTLTYELLFYLFIWLVYICGRLKQITLIGYIILAISLIALSLVKPCYPVIFKSFTHYFPLFTFFPLFMAGITFYQIKFEVGTPVKYLLIAICFVTQLLLYDETNRANFITYSQYWKFLFIYFTVFFLYIKNLLRFIVNPVTMFLGRISYSLYLIHNFIGYSILLPFLRYSDNFHLNVFGAIFLVTLPLIILMATLINKFIEVPATKYIKSKFSSLGIN